MIEGMLDIQTVQLNQRDQADNREDADTKSQTELTVNRRELLMYAWGAASLMLAAQTGAASYLFLSPRFREGEFGGKFALGGPSALPNAVAAPQSQPDGKFWLVNTADGPRALYMVCTHLGCLYKWNDEDGRFRCPCHGSEFSREGVLLKGPAARGLDQFVVEVVKDGAIVAATTDDADAITPPQPEEPAAEIVVNTGQRIKGRAASS